MPKPLQSRVAFVTGGAVRIGRSVCQAFAKAGYGVVIHCRNSGTAAKRLQAQIVVIDISLECDFSKSAKSDKLLDTVNYKELKDEILDMEAASEFFLLEKLAEKIADICLARDGVKTVKVCAEKPGALTGARTVGVEIVGPRQ